MSVPIGTIMMWSGNRDFVPQNWKICDGSLIEKRKHQKLCKIIGDSWGKGDAENCQLPDLRGVFVRGVTEERKDEYRDVDVNTRHASNGKINDVGSFQVHAFQKHDHVVRYRKAEIATGKHHAGEGKFTNVNANGATTTITGGGNETRPNNAYVYYIIKVA